MALIHSTLLNTIQSGISTFFNTLPLAEAGAL
jgi:hypothetical protein